MKSGSFINSTNIPMRELIIVVELLPLVLMDELQMAFSQIVYMLPPVLTHE